MKKQYMFKDDSGAVTVDWVVLTAALVIIGGVVIGIIRGGLIDASSAIDKTLVASATDLRSSLSGGGSASQSFADYMAAAAGGDLSAAIDAINADAPDGYTYSGWNETSSGTPLYFGNTESTGSSMSLGGTTYESGELTSNDFTYVGTSGPA